MSIHVPDVLCLVASLTFFWSSLVLAFGLLWPVKKRPKAKRNLRFVVLVCARNEERVVRIPVESALAADYPSGCREVIVLADNCTDATAEVAAAAGATVWKKDTSSTCKGDVLAWGLKRLYELGGFDAVAVFDADNRVSEGWFAAMNDALQDAETVVTGRRQASNARAGLVSGWYAVYWSLMNELSNRVRTNLGLSGKLTGTGFAFLSSALATGEWKTRTLVEDVEFTLQTNLAGGRVAYVPDAAYEDEQPVSCGAMWRQLLRWTTGGWQVLGGYFFAWAKTFVRHPSFRLFDAFYVLLTGMSLSFIFLSNVLGAVYRLCFGGIGSLAFVAAVNLLGMALFLTVAMGGLSVALSPRKRRPSVWAVLTFPVFSFVLSLAVLVSLVFPPRHWYPIAHKG